MNAATQSLLLQGPAGVLESLCDVPEGGIYQGTAVISHPHPLFGGTMQNKVVQTLARAFLQCGWQAVRFNFRGVGASAGSYDEGRGEAQDMLAVIAQLAPQGPLALAGFSFGAFVTSHVAQTLAPVRSPEKLVLVGTAASRFQVAPIAPEWHDRTLVLHGEQDDNTGTFPINSERLYAAIKGHGGTVRFVYLPYEAHGYRGKENVLHLLYEQGRWLDKYLKGK